MQSRKLDILVTAAHPDDAELSCGGTILKHTDAGYKVGILDFTRGEMGTRGNADIRDTEALAASKVLGLAVRENLAFSDAFFKNNNRNRLAIIRMIRHFQPEIVIANAPEDRHPDHARAAQLAVDACFLSGLRKIETKFEGRKQEAWRPKQVFHYIQNSYIKPDFVVDISEYEERKIEAVRAFKSQFHTEKYDENEPDTFISTPGFMKFLEARAREFGKPAGVEFAEGFLKSSEIKVNNLFDLVTEDS